MLAPLSAATPGYLLIAQPQSSSSSTLLSLRNMTGIHVKQDYLCYCDRDFGKPVFAMCAREGPRPAPGDGFYSMATTHSDVCNYIKP